VNLQSAAECGGHGTAPTREPTRCGAVAQLNVDGRDTPAARSAPRADPQAEQRSGSIGRGRWFPASGHCVWSRRVPGTPPGCLDESTIRGMVEPPDSTTGERRSVVVDELGECCLECRIRWNGDRHVGEIARGDVRRGVAQRPLDLLGGHHPSVRAIGVHDRESGHVTLREPADDVVQRWSRAASGWGHGCMASRTRSTCMRLEVRLRRMSIPRRRSLRVDGVLGEQCCSCPCRCDDGDHQRQDDRVITGELENDDHGCDRRSCRHRRTTAPIPTSP